MTQDEKIEAIHASDLYGCIFEAGAGSCIASALYEVEGASKTISLTMQPYSKHSQQEMFNYNEEKIKSVSGKMSLKMAVLGEDHSDFEEKVNFLMAATFQIGGEIKLTHGWICLNIRGAKAKLIHVSIPENKERREYFKNIAEIGIDLLYSSIDKDFIFSSPYVDNIAELGLIINEGGNIILPDFSTNKEKLLSCALNSNEESLLVFTPNELNTIRFEDFCRDKEGIILIRGSYNPIHERHIELMEQAKKQYPTYNAAFFISTDRFDKPSLTEKEVSEKIDKINELGYTVVIGKGALFMHSTSHIRTRWKLPIIYPIGMDTLNRFVDPIVSNELEFQEDFIGLWESHPIKNASGKNLSAPRERLPVDELMEGYTEKDSFKNNWGNTKFLVFDRKNIKMSDNTKYFTSIFDIEKDSIDVAGISSTKIRSGELVSKI